MNNNIKKDLVSIIIPCFNTAQYLPKAIESALNQTYSHLEVIIIDDGSTDNTKIVIKPFLKDIKYIYKENGGPASARNLGIARSRGEFIAFLDADDYWLHEKLEIQIEFLKNNLEYGLVHSNLLILEKGFQLYPHFSNNPPPSGILFKELFLENHINNLTVVVRRECINKVNGLDERTQFIGIEDYDLWLRIAMHFKIAFINKILAVYRVHSSNISSEKNIIDSQFVLLDKYSKIFHQNNTHYIKLLNEKRDKLYFRWGCWLLENQQYESAKIKFKLSIKRHYLSIHCILGLICCQLKSNIFFKSSTKAIKYRCYGNYFLSKHEYINAKKYYLLSLKHNPIQKIIIKYMFLFLKNLLHKA